MSQGIGRAAVTRNMSFDEAVRRLSQSPAVEGIAEFGSRASARDSATSDYDLLIVLHDLPAPVFQVITSINGRIADVVPVDAALVERITTEMATAISDRFNLMLVQKMRRARIVFDRTGLLSNAQAAAHSIPEQHLLPKPTSFAARYIEMFWQGFVIQQARRMSRSDDELHHLAADMMITSILTQTYRSYFDLRGLAWEGEKAALRHWQHADPQCYGLVRSLIGAGDLSARLIAYEALSRHVLDGYGEPIGEGQTAFMFASEASKSSVETMQNYWAALFDHQAA